MVWYYSCMESECPDPFPCMRVLPDDFEFIECHCCKGFVYYFGNLHRGGQVLGPLALYFQYSPLLGCLGVGIEIPFKYDEELCERWTKEYLQLPHFKPQCTG